MGSSPCGECSRMLSRWGMSWEVVLVGSSPGGQCPRKLSWCGVVLGVVLVGVVLVRSRPGGELSWWELSWWGVVLEKSCPGGELSRWELSSGQLS